MLEQKELAAEPGKALREKNEELNKDNEKMAEAFFLNPLYSFWDAHGQAG